MSRLLEVKKEQREDARRLELIKALEYGIAGALESTGRSLQGIAIRYHEFDVLMTIKVIFDDWQYVAHVGSDSMINCFLKVSWEASHDTLRWKKDKWYKPPA